MKNCKVWIHDLCSAQVSADGRGRHVVVQQAQSPFLLQSPCPAQPLMPDSEIRTSFCESFPTDGENGGTAEIPKTFDAPARYDA